MAAVAAANESDLQATDAGLAPAPTPAAALDPRLFMAARRGDSEALKDLLQLNDDDQQLQGTRPDDGGSGAPTTAAAATTTTTTSVAAAPSISPPHVIVEVEPPRHDAVAALLPPPPAPPVPVLDEDGVTIEGEPAPPHDENAAPLPARQTLAAAPAGHSAVPVVLDVDGVATATQEGSLLVDSEIVEQVVVEPPPPHDDAVAALLPPPPVPVLDVDGVTTHTEGGSLLPHSEIVEQVVVEPPLPQDDAAPLARQPPAAAPAGSFLAAVPVLDEDGVTMEGDSLLHVVAACGDRQRFLDCVDVIVRNKEKKGGAGAKRRALEARNNKGDTPLHCAAGAGNAQMISCLLAALITTTTDDDNEEARAAVMKAFLRMQNDCGETALHQAVRAAANKVDCIDYLMEVDPELACIPHEDGASPLYLAISLGELGIARHLCLHSNGKLSYSGPDGRNVLHEAIRFDTASFKKILELIKDTKPKEDSSSVSLISHLTSQRDRKHKGSTPLHLAASMWECQVELLLDANESTVYQADDEGSYPIHVAAWFDDCLVIVKMLLERCPDCATLRDGKGRTFFHVAAKKKNLAVVRYVVSGEMPQRWSSMILNAQDSNGDTALHAAVRSGDLAVFNCLLRNPQVRLDVANKDGMTPADISWIMLPEGFYYEFNPRNIVHRSLDAAGAPSSRVQNSGFFNEKHLPKRDLEEESKKFTEATQLMSIVTALIATVTFASAFTLPGGYRSDGEPVLAGSYAFDAFILADTMAFICSITATYTLIYAGLPVMDSEIRRTYSTVSQVLLQSAARSLVAAFGLGLYLVVHNTASAIAACAIVFASLLYGNMELRRIIGIATTVRARIGIRRHEVVICLKAIFTEVLVHFWSYIVIFGLPAIRKQVH